MDISISSQLKDAIRVEICRSRMNLFRLQISGEGERERLR